MSIYMTNKINDLKKLFIEIDKLNSVSDEKQIIQVSKGILDIYNKLGKFKDLPMVLTILNNLPIGK